MSAHLPVPRYWKTVVIAACLLSACSTSTWWPFGERSDAEVRPRYPGATAYSCDGGKRLLVQYGPGNRYAMIIFPDREFRLDATAAGGAGYGNGRTTLLLQNGEARLEEGGAAIFANCKAEPGNP